MTSPAVEEPVPLELLCGTTGVHVGALQRGWAVDWLRRRTALGAYVVWGLLVAAVLPWRSEVYFDGGFDTVVLAKAVLSGAAVLIAIGLARAGVTRHPVPAAPVVLIVSYLCVTVLGGMAQGLLFPAAAVAFRVLLLVAAIACLVSRYSAMVAMRSLVHVLGAVATAAAITGLPVMTEGRLGGGVPSLNPNELALFAALCLLWVFAKVVRGIETVPDLLAAGFFLGVLLLTGSRTALGTTALALVLLLTLRCARLNRRSFLLVSVGTAALLLLVLRTQFFSDLVFRGGAQSVTTLNNRTTAWDAALRSHGTTFEQIFGAGLSQKYVAVPGQWWNTQLLDSSWISALVQSGLLGLGIVAVLVLSTILRAATTPGRDATLWLGISVFLAARGFLESGLFDGSVAFLALMVTVLGVRSPRAKLRGDTATRSIEVPA